MAEDFASSFAAEALAASGQEESGADEAEKEPNVTPAEAVMEELELDESTRFSLDDGTDSLHTFPYPDEAPPSPITVTAELPASYVDFWDDSHVRLPCSPSNTYRRRKDPSKRLSRWYLIQSSLADFANIRTSHELQDAILSYQSSSARLWDFTGLHSFFQSHLSAEDSKRFFAVTLPQIIKLALRLPELVPDGIPLLIPQVDQTVELSQLQVACLLANCFLCTMPLDQGKPAPAKKAGGGDAAAAAESADGQEAAETERYFYQPFTCKRLFEGTANGRITTSQAGKLVCLITYFSRVTRIPPTGRVTFHRQVLATPPDWENSEALLREVKVVKKGLIEEFNDTLQADFANKFIGGGVLGRGCVQEEIRFMICPELLASLLFTAEMQDNETCILTGAERFSNYTGYSSTFNFAGPHLETQERDEKGRLKVKVAAFDALHFGLGKRERWRQYRWSAVQRELNKAYCAFMPEPSDPSDISTVTTGNWGCGVFGGFLDLKAVLQLMACAQAGKDVNYCTFGEAGLHRAIKSMHAFLREKGATVGRLYQLLREYGEVLAARKKDPYFEVNPFSQEQARAFPPDLFGFIRDSFDPPPPYVPSDSDDDEATQELDGDVVMKDARAASDAALDASSAAPTFEADASAAQSE
mmetsp:Transcript_18958/g.73043  ORF Transcript_18958/g.73043 Transcript_18958/m.73043 type:complete len:644 (+) Transcript_18958:1-1932(+)